MARNDRENEIYDEKNNKSFLQNYHIADGGYFDNAGALTAMEWLNNFLKYNDSQENQDHFINIKKVLLLQINAFSEEKLDPNQQGSKGFNVVIFGPLKTLNNIRDSTQIERNKKVAELLEERWLGKGIEIKDFTISFPEKNLKGEDYNPPLSWRLTKQQKENLVEAWRCDEVIGETVNQMKIFLNGSQTNRKKCAENVSKM